MRILFVIFVSLLMCSMVGCGEPDDNVEEETSEEQGAAATREEQGAAATLSPASWHELEQSERIQKILTVALNDYGDNVGLSCKKWVQDVIRRASDGHVKVPLNTKKGDSWQPDPEGHVIRYRHNDRPALLNTSPGDIVQIQWKQGLSSSNPDYNIHTAIIFSVSSKGVIFIESNYDDTPEIEEDAVVSVRFESETEFHERVQAFSVYSIR